MSDASSPPLAYHDRERLRKRDQRRMVEIRQIWDRWLAFEGPLREKEPEYLKKAHDLRRRISQEIAIAWNVDRHRIRWDEARNRVLTLETLEEMAARFGKSHSDVYRDVARLASHESWMAKLNASGDYWMLGAYLRELRGGQPQATPPCPAFAPPPPPPIVLKAAEIRRMVDEGNAELQEAERRFLGDEPATPKTREFEFLEAAEERSGYSRSGRKIRKPRKNWRREIGT